MAVYTHPQKLDLYEIDVATSTFNRKSRLDLNKELK